MLRTLLDARTLLALAMGLAVRVSGLRTYPLPTDNVYLALVELRRPDIYQGLQYTYAALYFRTPFFGASLLGSLYAIAMYRRAPRFNFRSLPPYIRHEDRPKRRRYRGKRTARRVAVARVRSADATYLHRLNGAVGRHAVDAGSHRRPRHQVRRSPRTTCGASCRSRPTS